MLLTLALVKFQQGSRKEMNRKNQENIGKNWQTSTKLKIY